MKSYFDSIQILFNNSNKLLDYIKFKNIKLLESINNVSYTTLLSDKDIPFFCNSAMDGYAICSQHTVDLSFSKSKVFKIIDVVMAGESVGDYDLDGDCVVEIMTGARLPSCFDSVIKFEDVIFDSNSNNKIILNRFVKLGENVRQIGEDFKLGDIIIRKGEMCSPCHLMSLSTFGIKTVNILNKPCVYLVCSGNEIVESVNLNKCVDIDNVSCINNTTAPYIISFLKILGIEVHYLGLVKDNVNDFKLLLTSSLPLDVLSLVITTGAVSKGKADFIPLALKSMGVNILFHGVKIKPGKPILFAKYSLKTYFFGLPGNPISSVIGLRFFVYPFLRLLMGQAYEKPFKAILDLDYLCKRRYDTFLKAYSYFSGSSLRVKILDDQESFKINSMLKSNSFVFLKSIDRSKKGDVLDVFFYNPFFLS